MFNNIITMIVGDYTYCEKGGEGRLSECINIIAKDTWKNCAATNVH